MDQLVLRFHYVGQESDLIIDDVDKVMWIDLIIEYEEGFRKKGYQMPKFPSFHYCYNMKDVMLKTDSDLMSMLDRLSTKKVIYVYVGSVDKPTDCVTAARKLSETLKYKDKMHIGSSPPSNINIPVNNESIRQDFDDEAINHAIEEHWHDIEISNEIENLIEPLVEGKGPKSKAPLKSQAKKLPVRRNPPNNEPDQSQSIYVPLPTYSNAPPINQEITTPSSSNLSLNAALVLHKIPKSTAARRRLLGSTQPIAQVIRREKFHEQLEQVQSTNVGGGSVQVQSNDVDEGSGQGSDQVQPAMVVQQHDFVDNDDYVHYDEQDNGDDQENDDEYIDMVHDNYDPYEDDLWQRDMNNDDSYFSRIYKNGEFVGMYNLGVLC
ncbi:uncharacterized protein [Spinacia oleracea]|nr:uncharacterized protein LOC110778545 isoform X2 [Spinacia oleracea]XP_021838787.2 uncharacterized protein LOC110778545 isoform X2 [Spinacia oleracea]